MVQAVRGMRDVLPMEARRWRHIESRVQQVLRRFGYEEVQLPLLEFTDLFARGVGEATDIVEKEMYTLADRDGDSLSLRPEGTASCVRALQENGLLYNQTQKVFYAGPMFRYEKPQRGRYRQFYQVGAEAFGFAGPDVDAELILLGAEFFKALGLSERVRLEVNTLGSSADRQAYRKALVDYLTPHLEELDEDSQRRLHTNPLRILDSKNERTQALLVQAPQLPEFVDAASQAHFAELLALLDGLDISYTCNPNLVRGLDYYTHTVFEWITDDLGAQGAVCAGGRYDGLVERLGGRAMPSAGFGMGLERVLLLHEFVHQNEVSNAVDVYVCYADNELALTAQQTGMRLRNKLEERLQDDSEIKVRVHMGGGSFKKQLKRANGCGAAWAVLIGADEIASNTLTLKELGSGEQDQLAEMDLIERISDAHSVRSIQQ
jgi:histidyl-tRNA synthetase